MLLENIKIKHIVVEILKRKKWLVNNSLKRNCVIGEMLRATILLSEKIKIEKGCGWKIERSTSLVVENIILRSKKVVGKC